MKHLLTLTALLISSLAMGQFPNLPYNPDDNADGLIGVADLQTLLANYGQEFSSAVVSEDGESAIVYMGEMGYLECAYTCQQLPGFWQVSSVLDLSPVMAELNAGASTYSWVNKADYNNISWDAFPHYRGTSNADYRRLYSTTIQAVANRCYCAAKQLPRVEYCMCTGDINDGNENAITVCADEKVSAGWIPLGGLGAANGIDGQAFWRWAE